MRSFAKYFQKFWPALSGRNNLHGDCSEGVALGYDGFRLSGDSMRLRGKIPRGLNFSGNILRVVLQANGLRHRSRGQRPRSCGNNEFCPVRAIQNAFIATIFAFTISLFSANGANNSLTDAQLLQIKFDQKLNSQVSPDLIFRDSTGKQVRLGDYFGKRPIVLILGYYTCPMLCALTLNGATESFRDLKWSVGKNFDVVYVSIDPHEKTKLAAAKKRTYLRDYGRPGSENGWHFLTGKEMSIKPLAKEVGFHYAYDAGIKEYAHPSGFVILTPEGKVAHYFFGVTFSPKEVNSALHDAGAKKIDSPVAEFILLCCEYSPLRGKYGHLIMDLVRVGGVTMVFALGFYFFRGGRKRTPVAAKNQDRAVPVATDKR